MATTQLNVRVPLALAEQLRQAAQLQGRGVGAVVVQALIAHLAPASSPASTPLAIASPALAVQLAAIEQRLQILEQLSPIPEQPLALSLEALPLPERRLTAAEAEGLLPLPQVVERLGLSGGGSAVTNWIARETIKNAGNVPLGAVYRGWRLRGKGLLPGGQKAGWLFDLAEF